MEVRGDGSPLEGTLVILLLRGLFGLSRELEATTGVSGAVSFSFGSFWTPSALVVLPADGFWSVVVRGPTNSLTVECPRLPATGPLAWWHETHGVTAFDAQRRQEIRIGVADTSVGPHPAEESQTYDEYLYHCHQT